MEKSKYIFEETNDNHGFFCMKLSSYILEEMQEIKDWGKRQELYTKRWDQAKSNNDCFYKDHCPIFKRTIKKQRLKVRLCLQYQNK